MAGNPARRTFELACDRARSGVQHRSPDCDPDQTWNIRTAALIGTARELCAIQILTGHAGYDEWSAKEKTPEYLGLESIPGNDRTTLQPRPGHSKLFDVSGPKAELCRIPIHRQVAEFLGSRYPCRD